MIRVPAVIIFFFFNDTATTEIYTLSLHDALPIYLWVSMEDEGAWTSDESRFNRSLTRSEEHTSELQSPCNLVCRLLLEKKKAHRRRLLQSRLTGLSTQPALTTDPHICWPALVAVL